MANLDFGHDWEVWDNREAVVLRSRPSGDGTPEETAWQALRRPATQDDRMFLGVEASVTVERFTLYEAGQGTDPKFGDLLTDGKDVGWQVRDVTAVVLRTAFECLCVQDAA